MSSQETIRPISPIGAAPRRDPIVRTTGILAALAAFGLIVFFAAIIFVMTSDVFRGDAFPVDFAAFWASAQLALDGRAIEAFDQTVIAQAITIPPEYAQQRFFWMYPPTWAMVTTPLGILPFWAAWPRPVSFSGMSRCPCIRPSRFQSVSPCRIRINEVRTAVSAGAEGSEPRGLVWRRCGDRPSGQRRTRR